MYSSDSRKHPLDKHDISLLCRTEYIQTENGLGIDCVKQWEQLCVLIPFGLFPQMFSFTLHVEESFHPN